MSDEENREKKTHRQCVGNRSKVPPQHLARRKCSTEESLMQADLEKILDYTINIERALKVDKQKPTLDEIQFKLDALSETHELDFICWEAAAKCMKKTRELLSKARREVNELRMENQQLKEFLKATKNEGEKYKNQLESEILRKLLNEL